MNGLKLFKLHDLNLPNSLGLYEISVLSVKVVRTKI